MSTSFAQQVKRWSIRTSFALLLSALPFASMSRPAYAQSGTPSATPTASALVEIIGPITAITGKIITVNGLQIDLSVAEVKGVLKVGATVKVEGSLGTNNTVSARQAAVSVVAQAPKVELTGAVTAITKTTIVVNGQTIDISGAEVYAGVKVGANVQLEFTLINGQLVLREVSPVRARVQVTPSGTKVKRDDDANDDNGRGSGKSGSDDDANDDNGRGSGNSGSDDDANDDNGGGSGNSGSDDDANDDQGDDNGGDDSDD